MKKMMKKAAMGMQNKPDSKKGKIISESGDLADALNETIRMRKAGTAPKTDKDAGKYMDKLSKKGKLGPKMKMGGTMKKAQLGMKSVKAGYDNNKGVTRADFVSIGKGEAKKGTKMKKAMMGVDMMQSPMMKKGGAMKKCKYGCK
jgi:hypothetical protein